MQALALPKKQRGLTPIAATLEGMAARNLPLIEPTERICQDCGQVFTTTFRPKWVCDGCVASFRKFGSYASRAVTREAQLDARLTGAGILGIWKEHGRLESFRAREQPTAYNQTQRFIDYWPKEIGLAFSGGVGTGKTHLVIGIARYLLDKGISARYVHVPTMAWAMKTADIWAREASAQTRPLYTADLVILDDVGRERETPALREALDALMDDRWVRRKPTILATNLSLDALRGWLGEASASRFCSEAVMVTMADGDRRLRRVEDLP